MTRFAMIPLCVLCLTLGVLAVQDPAKEPEPILKKKTKKDAKADDPQDDKKVDPKDKKDPKELKKIEPGDVPVIGGGEKPEEIIARIKKNMQDTSKELEDNAADATRKKQRDIVKDLDDLINQQNDANDNQNNSGGGQSGNQGGGQAGNQGSKSGRKGGSRNQGSAKAGQKGNAGAQDSANNQANAGQNPQNKKGGAGGKDGQGGNPGGGNSPPNEAKSKKPADLSTDIWGHLPQHKRLEMDAYMQERYLQRYGPILHQYFRTIAEKSRGPEKR